MKRNGLARLRLSGWPTSSLVALIGTVLVLVATVIRVQLTIVEPFAAAGWASNYLVLGIVSGIVTIAIPAGAVVLAWLPWRWSHLVVTLIAVRCIYEVFYWADALAVVTAIVAVIAGAAAWRRAARHFSRRGVASA